MIIEIAQDRYIEYPLTLWEFYGERLNMKYKEVEKCFIYSNGIDETFNLDRFHGERVYVKRIGGSSYWVKSIVSASGNLDSWGLKLEYGGHYVVVRKDDIDACNAR